MNWLSVKYATESAAILVLAGCTLYAAHDFHETNVAVRSGVVQTLGSLNAPCKDIHGDVICGPIPQLSQTEKNIGILAAQGAEQTKQSGKLVDAATKAVNQASADIQASLKPLPTAIQSFSAAATALTGTAHSASGMLDEATTTLKSFQPVATDADASVRQFNALLQSPDVTGMLKHGNEITGNAALITGDFYHFEQPILNPVPCKTKRCKFSRFMKSELPWWIDLGAKTEQMSEWWRAIPVSIKK